MPAAQSATTLSLYVPGATVAGIVTGTPVATLKVPPLVVPAPPTLSLVWNVPSLLKSIHICALILTDEVGDTDAVYVTPCSIEQ